MVVMVAYINTFQLQNQVNFYWKMFGLYDKFINED